MGNLCCQPAPEHHPNADEPLDNLKIISN